jgi:hypothetical protein
VVFAVRDSIKKSSIPNAVFTVFDLDWFDLQFYFWIDSDTIISNFRWIIKLFLDNSLSLTHIVFLLSLLIPLLIVFVPKLLNNSCTYISLLKWKSRRKKGILFRRCQRDVGYGWQDAYMPPVIFMDHSPPSSLSLWGPNNIIFQLRKVFLPLCGLPVRPTK